MRFLLKLATICFLALLILPSIYPDAGKDEDVHDLGDRVTAMQLAVSSATFAAGVAADMKDLCQRDAHVCAHGNLVFAMAMERARRGAQIAKSLIYPSNRTSLVDTQTTTASVKSDP
ncbi:MAG: DUF5330 domain-containing protein [Pseudomonadota bacterium]